MIAACSAAADELQAARTLISALDAENAALKARLATEQRISATLSELDRTRAAESDGLRTALAAKDEALRAKDAVIASQDKLIAALKTKRPGAWRRIGDILIGAAAGMVLR